MTNQKQTMKSFNSDVGSLGVLIVPSWSKILVALLVATEAGGSGSMHHEKKKLLRNNHVYLDSATRRVSSVTTANDRRQLDGEGTASSTNNIDADEDTEVLLPPVKYIGTMGRTCQGKFNTMGEVDINYKLVRNLTLKGCMEACSAANNGTKGSIGGSTATETATTDGQENSTSTTTDDEESYYCAGYQHTTFDEGTTECHLWYHYGPGDGVEDLNSFCFWKADLGSGQQCCIPTTEMKTDLCASEGSSGGNSINFPAVKCGPQQCEYDNYCLALVAGNFLKEECTEQCTEPVDEYNSCDGQPFSPVQCTKGGTTSSTSTSTTSRSSTSTTIGSNLKCTYNNLCLAQKAGYTTLDSTCEDVCPTVGGSGSSTNNEKRSTTGAFTCAATTDTTGTNSATSSESDTTTVNSTPICDINTTNVVAPSTNGTTSTSNNNFVNSDVGNSTSGSAGTGGGIVLCGVHQCPYDNICLGMEAGFAMEQCASI